MFGDWNRNYRDCSADGECRGTERDGRDIEPEPVDRDHLLDHLGLNLGNRRGLSLRAAHRDSGHYPVELPRYALGLYSSVEDRRNSYPGVSTGAIRSGSL